MRYSLIVVMVSASLCITNEVHAQYLYVAASGDNTLSRISPDGSVSQIAKYTDGDFYNTLAYDGKSHLLVAGTDLTRTSHRSQVVIYALSGKRVPKSYPRIFDPFCCCTDRNGDIYVADRKSNRDLTTTIKEIMPGGRTRLFFRPSFDFVGGLCTDSHGMLFVIDFNHNLIIRIDSHGTAHFFAKTELEGPYGMAIDAKNNVYICAVNANIIKKFSPAGIGTFFASDGLNGPQGMAFDATGNLYVANFVGGNIMKYTPSGKRTIVTKRKLDGPAALAFGPAPKKAF